MPSTVSPAEAVNAVKQESLEPFDRTTCRLDASAASDEDLDHSLVLLAGDIPPDAPYWSSQLHGDARGLSPKGIRFVSKSDATLITRVDVQDRARDAIWTKLSKLLPPHALPCGLPSIFFNERPLAEGTRRGIIDLVFTRMDAYHASTELKQLSIEGIGNDETHIFKYRTRTGSMPGNLLAVQCIGLPIDDLDAPALFKALGAMCSVVGTVIGLAKIVIHSDKWEIEEQYSGAVRFWIDIKPDNMAISWSRLVTKLPTHARINGFPYALSYADRELHSEDVFSSNYTVPPPDEKDSKASIKRSRSTHEAADSNGSRKKKVKKQEEEEDEEEE